MSVNVMSSVQVPASVALKGSTRLMEKKRRVKGVANPQNAYKIYKEKRRQEAKNLRNMYRKKNREKRFNIDINDFFKFSEEYNIDINNYIRSLFFEKGNQFGFGGPDTRANFNNSNKPEKEALVDGIIQISQLQLD